MKLNKDEIYVLDRLLAKNGKSYFLALPNLPDENAIRTLADKGLVSHIEGKTTFTIWARLNHGIYQLIWPL